MAHLPKLIEDLALILLAAGVTTLLFRKLKQPLVLGYIIAGFLVGPHTNIMPTVVDTENINVLAEMGVIFLLFSLGLEFSFKKLARVGGAASVTAIVKVVGVMALGYMAGRWMGWSSMDSIFLGGILCISSTTIVIRALEELGLKNKQFARIVFGSLIIEDLVAILLLVLLSTLAVSRQFAGMEMLLSVAKLIFFLSLWFLSGIFILPTVLKMVKKLLNDEILLIVSLALCLGLVVLATHTGFSPALGAFVMGSILAETTLAERIEHLVLPVKDLFGAVFFVSVGILIDPNTIIEHGWPVLIITLITIFGKFIMTFIGAAVSGQPLKQSVQVGMSLAQIGEFSFIIAQLGQSLHVTSDFLYPIAVAVATITTFTTTYLIKLSDPFNDFIYRMIPTKWVGALNKYASGTRQIQAESEWKKVLQSYAVIIGLNAVIAIAIILLTTTFLAPISRKYIESQSLAHFLVLLITVLFAGPFFWAMMVRKPHSSAFTDLWLDRKYNRGPLLIIEVGRNILAVLIFGLLLDRLFSSSVALIAGIFIFAVVMFIFSQKLQVFYARIETRFLKNLNARELAASNKDSPLSPWDAHLATLVVHPDVSGLGKTLEELGWREKYGINIAGIDRGQKHIQIPSRYERIFPYDKLSVIGTDLQLQLFRSEVEYDLTESIVIPVAQTPIELVSIIVDEHNHLRGQSIRSSNIREKTEGLVVGIERNGQRILNPDSNTVFEWDDVLWIVGNKRKILQLSEDNQA